MTATIDAATLKAWLSDGGEIALLDVREVGQFGEGHLFFAVPLPYSRFELALPALVPNPAVRLVLCDGGDDAIAGRAAKRAEALGYRNVHVLAGGTEAWKRAGYTLYAGVNVPSKTFGELVEHEKHTPHITAQDLEAMRRAGENFVIVDGRTFAEYRKMNIPGGICCPNGELVLRIGAIAPDPATKIVVNCAGRTRSIIGAQTLIDFGIANPVVALENGTQGWTLAGLDLEHGAGRRYADGIGAADIAARKARARALAEAHGAAFVTAAEAQAWRSPMPRARPICSTCARPRSLPRAPCPASPMRREGSSCRQRTSGWASRARGSCFSTRKACARRSLPAGCASSATRLACWRAGSSPLAGSPARDPQSIPAVASEGDRGPGGGGRTAPGYRAGHRPAPRHELPRGAHRAGPLVDPAAYRAGRRGHVEDRGARGRRARPGGTRCCRPSRSRLPRHPLARRRS